MKQYETNSINNGCQIAYKSVVTGIKQIKGGYEITLLDADNLNYSFTTKILINSAGLASDKIAEMAGIKDDNLKILFCKGEYSGSIRPKTNLLPG
jgi:L-2-hydroxyglutarate oxidase LhgO